MQVVSIYQLPDSMAKVRVTYTLASSGEITVDHRLMGVKEGLPNMPRFGSNFVLSRAYDRVRWYGRGPHENYQDRHTAAFVGDYQASVDELYFAYPRPQENGYRTDVRWVTLTDADGQGIRIIGDQPLGFSVHHQYNSDFDSGPTKQQRHCTDIVPRDLVNVNVDAEQMGVGGDNSWGFEPLEKYQIEAKERSYSYTIAPVR